MRTLTREEFRNTAFVLHGLLDQVHCQAHCQVRCQPRCQPHSQPHALAEIANKADVELHREAMSRCAPRPRRVIDLMSPEEPFEPTGRGSLVVHPLRDDTDREG